MKISSLASKLAVVAALVGMGASQLAIAQPSAAPAKAKRGRKAKGGLTPKAQAKIETALGKPLTAEQKTQLDAAANTRKTAVKAATDAYMGEVARVTGMTVEQVKALDKKTAKPKA